MLPVDITYYLVLVYTKDLSSECVHGEKGTVIRYAHCCYVAD